MLAYFKNNLQTFILILIVTGLGFSLYFLSTKTTFLSTKTTLRTCQQDNLIKTLPVNLGNLPPYGQANAAIKIVEFSDYLCPFCALTATEFYPKIESLIKNGEVVIFYRDFPVHQNADRIANAARCANEQGKFWEFNLKIFQRFLDSQNTTKNDTWFDIAKELGLNDQQFKTCIEGNRYIQDVKNDLNNAMAQGLSGTPTFFIQSGNNAFKVVGIDEACLMSAINKFKDLNK